MSYTRSKRKPKRRQRATSRSVGSVTARSKNGATRVRKLEDIKFIQGSDNVFEDLGFDREKAANLKIRADLMIDLREYIRAAGGRRPRRLISLARHSRGLVTC
jgi:hypothetical protein